MLEQGWELAFSLFHSKSLFRSKSLFLKELPWAICSRRSLKKSDTSESLFKKEWLFMIHSQKNSYFSHCLWQFMIAFPLFMPKSESLFTKEQPWVNRFLRSLQKSSLLLTKNERFAWKTKEQIPNPVLEILYHIERPVLLKIFMLRAAVLREGQHFMQHHLFMGCLARGVN